MWPTYRLIPDPDGCAQNGMRDSFEHQLDFWSLRVCVCARIYQGFFFFFWCFLVVDARNWKYMCTTTHVVKFVNRALFPSYISPRIASFDPLMAVFRYLYPVHLFSCQIGCETRQSTIYKGENVPKTICLFICSWAYEYNDPMTWGRNACLAGLASDKFSRNSFTSLCTKNLHNDKESLSTSIYLIQASTINENEWAGWSTWKIFLYLAC